jgi:hypothetical protein
MMSDTILDAWHDGCSVVSSSHVCSGHFHFKSFLRPSHKVHQVNSSTMVFKGVLALALLLICRVKSKLLIYSKIHPLCTLQGKFVIHNIRPVETIMPAADKCKSKPEISINIVVHRSDLGSNVELDDALSDTDSMCFVLDFSTYKEFKLHPIKDVELPELNLNGSVDSLLLSAYMIAKESNWKLVEGSILYVLAEYDNFLNCTVQFQSICQSWVTELPDVPKFGRCHGSQRGVDERSEL